MHNARAGAPTKQQLSRERPARGAGAPAGVPRASRIADPLQPGQPAQLHAHPGFPAASHPHPWGSARRCASPPQSPRAAPPRSPQGRARWRRRPSAPELGAPRPAHEYWCLPSPWRRRGPGAGAGAAPVLAARANEGAAAGSFPPPCPPPRAAASRSRAGRRVARGGPAPRRGCGGAAGGRRRCCCCCCCCWGRCSGRRAVCSPPKAGTGPGGAGVAGDASGTGLAPAPCPQLFRPEVWGDAGSGAERGGSHLGCAPGSAAAPRCSAAELGRSARLAARPYELLRFVFAVRGRSPFFSSRVRGKLQLALSFVGLVCLPRMIARWPTSGGQWFFVALTFSKLGIAESKPRKRVGTCGATAACPGGAGRSGGTAASLAANK